MLASQLLATKFQAPPARPNRVIRARLVQKLEQGCASGSRLSLICAPAGYGKTTLAVEWLNTGKRFSWLTLDESENDPGAFFTCLVAALQKIDPHIGQSTLSLLSIPALPPVEVLTGELINEISAVDEPFLLVLDDYHQIRTQAIHDVMETLLAHQPPNLHLLITTREDPAFPLGRLRARGQLTEIRARDLRFDADEVGSFLRQMHQVDLPPEAIEKLLAVTEGWAAGLQLTGLALQDEGDFASFFDSFTGQHQYIIEYLLEEVLRRQDASVRLFLERTSILEKFNAELCEAVISGQGSVDGEQSSLPGIQVPSLIADHRSLISLLEHSNLFITPLDSTHTWFRYHRLFADVLRAGLDPKTEAGLHLRAARWFDQNGMPAEAIPHYLAAGATQDAGRLVRGLSENLVRNGELQTLLRWIQALPAEEIRAHQELLAVQALALLLTGQIAKAAALLQSAEPIDKKKEGSGPLLAVKAWLTLVCQGNTGLQDLAQQALAAMAPGYAIFRVLALISLGTGYAANQNIGASTEAFYEAYLAGQRMQHPFAALAGLANYVFNLLDTGQLRKAKALCLDAIARYTDPRGKALPVLGMIYVPFSNILYEQNDLEQAKSYAKLGQELCQKLFSSGMMGGDAEVVLANIAFIRGERDEAYRIIESLRAFAVQQRVAFLEDKMTFLETDLRLREGDIAGARDYMDYLSLQNRTLVPSGPPVLRMFKAQILFAEGRGEEALALLSEIEESSRAGGYNRRLIGLLAIKAALLDRSGRRADAAAALEEAIRAAAPEGYFRSTLRGGAAIAPLLFEVRECAPGFVDALGEALGLVEVAAPETQSAPVPSVPVPQAAPASAGDLVEPLSEQERNVLRLLAAGRSNQEIAEELVISTGTAKWHVHNILAKLGASSRSEAAAMAREKKLV